MKDLLQREIQNGDWLVRSFNLGRSAALKFVKVINGNTRTIGVTLSTYYKPEGGWNLDGSMGSINYGERAMIVHEAIVPMEVIQLVAEYENKKGFW